MTKARQHRLKEARQWFENQNFTEDSHIVKAYRKRFNVDNTCAKRELCMLGVLSPHKQAAYEEQLKAKDVKKKRGKVFIYPCLKWRPERLAASLRACLHFFTLSLSFSSLLSC